MNDEKHIYEEDFAIKPTHILVVIIGVIICSIAIFFGSIWVFNSPSLASGFGFGAILLVFFVTPFVLLIVFYFKRLRKAKEPQKKEAKILRIK